MALNVQRMTFDGLIRKKDLYGIIGSGNLELLQEIMDAENVSASATIGGDPVFFIAMGLDAIAGGDFQPRIAEFLVERGADVDMTNEDGETALTAAADLLELEALQFLIRNGADPSIRTRKGETAYKMAAASIEQYQNMMDESRMRPRDKEAMAQKIREGMKILKLLAPISEKNVGNTKAYLRPLVPMRNITGALAVRGIQGKRLPRNVVGEIRKFMTAKAPRSLGKYRVKPTELGLRHVNTSLFENNGSARRRRTRRVRHNNEL